MRCANGTPNRTFWMSALLVLVWARQCAPHAVCVCELYAIWHYIDRQSDDNGWEDCVLAIKGSIFRAHSPHIPYYGSFAGQVRSGRPTLGLISNPLIRPIEIMWLRDEVARAALQPYIEDTNADGLSIERCLYRWPHAVSFFLSKIQYESHSVSCIGRMEHRCRYAFCINCTNALTSSVSFKLL